MAISKLEKAAFNDEIKVFKKEVDDNFKKISENNSRKKKFPKIEAYYSFENAYHLIKIISMYFQMNDLSMEMLKIKNENYLNSARKEFYKVIQIMEEIVGKDVDRSLKENDVYLAQIDQLTPPQILNFVEMLQTVLTNLKTKFGEGTKWKWSFVELQSRIAVITKNITKFSDIAKYRDPRTPFWKERQQLMRLCKENLTEAARQWRAKYEMAGKAREDLTNSIELLSALRKIHVLFGEDEDATKLKNTIDAAKMALESEDKSKEKEKK